MLRGPVAVPTLPGSMTEVSTTAADGATVRGWLVLPEGARRHASATVAMDPRRAARLVERVVVEVEPLADGRGGLCSADARPGHLDRYGRAFIARGWGRGAGRRTPT